MYTRYYQAKRRCESPKSPKYGSYGGRGIKFLFRSVHEFIDCLGPAPSPKHQVDRIDNDDPYAPWNVKWSSPSEQMKNRRPLDQWNYKDQPQQLPRPVAVDETEQLRVQLAACLTAAEGWGMHETAKQGEYGWSPAYQATVDLRKKYQELLNIQEEIEIESSPFTLKQSD